MSQPTKVVVEHISNTHDAIIARFTEAVVWRCSVKKLSLKLSQSSLVRPGTLLKKRLSATGAPGLPMDFAKFLISGGCFWIYFHQVKLTKIVN